MVETNGNFDELLKVVLCELVEIDKLLEPSYLHTSLSCTSGTPSGSHSEDQKKLPSCLAF